MVSICDRELLGRTVKDGELEMKISSEYFGEEQISLDEALKLIKMSHIVNLAGTRIVERTVEEGLASKLAVKRVGDTFFLLIFKFPY